MLRRAPVTPPVLSTINPTRWGPILHRVPTKSARVHAGNAVKFLIDGHDAFREMVASIRSATSRSHYVYILGWVLYDDFELIRGDRSSTMRQLLSAAAGRDVQIRVMLWDQPAFISPREAAANTGAVGRINLLRTGGAIVDNETLLTIRVPPIVGPEVKTGSHHQKVLVVQGSDGLVA